ncbi:MAG: hypothetical protein HKN54_03105 [Flavobacteriaceae bacterium]|nr:hypothetical protein [Flavobacteriaceae bacterium]
MKTVILIVRIVIAVICGEVILVLGTTLAQEVIVDGLNWYSSSKVELALGGFGSLLAAVISGIVAYMIVKKKSLIPIVILSILVCIETSWLIGTGRSEEPLWFSIVAGATLVLGFWIGVWILNHFKPSVNK